jgi:putative restriction endonuclease
MPATFWWINHTHTSRQEIEGSYLWFSNRSHRSKARSESEKNIQRLSPGDVVFSFADGLIGAVGVVLGLARESARPPELAAVDDQADANQGWLVPVRFMSLERPLRAEDHIGQLTPALPRKHSPLLPNGGSNQHVVLAAVPPLMAEILSGLFSGELERLIETIVESAGRGLADEAAEAAIQRRTDISAAQKSELLKSRHGQGSFRINLERNEHSCRITGVLDRRHLWARHIKPWCQCDDSEKLDGCNGLLMSPHVAHLFERGYISFSDDGDLLVSQELNPVVLNNWHIQLPCNAGQFLPEQCYFLDYHRREVFQQHGAGRRQKPPQTSEPEAPELTMEPAIVQPA